MRRLAITALALGAAICALRCSSFSDNDASADAGGSESGTSDALAEGGPDAGGGAACSADLSTDPKSCGACGHDCLGGTCKAGACEPFFVAKGLKSPSEIALDGARVYFEVLDGTTHTIASCSRLGCGPAGPELVASGLADVQSILVHQGLLFFVTHDGSSAENRLDVCEAGDLAKCTATRRPVEVPVTSVFDAFTAVRRGVDGVYWGKQDTTDAILQRASFEAGAPTSLGMLGCNAKRVSPGNADVVWSCFDGTIRSCPLPCTVDGGTEVADAGGGGEIERGGFVVFEDKNTGDLTVIGSSTLRKLPSRGQGPFTVVGSTLLFQDGTTRDLSSCSLPACLSVTKLASASATRLVADAVAVYWTDGNSGYVYGLAR